MDESDRLWKLGRGSFAVSSEHEPGPDAPPQGADDNARRDNEADCGDDVPSAVDHVVDKHLDNAADKEHAASDDRPVTSGQAGFVNPRAEYYWSSIT